MKFSKKFLATLLPIAATSGLVPALVSCNNNTGWVINYGDSINCLNNQPSKEEPAYHSIDDVKNGVKNRVGAIEPEGSIIYQKDLPSWYDGDQQKQILYFDFIASHSLLNPKEFELIWKKDTNLTITYYDKDYTEGVTGDMISYHVTADKEVHISIDNGGAIQYASEAKSYIYQNIWVK